MKPKICLWGNRGSVTCEAVKGLLSESVLPCEILRERERERCIKKVLPPITKWVYCVSTMKDAYFLAYILTVHKAKKGIQEALWLGQITRK